MFPDCCTDTKQCLGLIGVAIKRLLQTIDELCDCPERLTSLHDLALIGHVDHLQYSVGVVHTGQRVGQIIGIWCNPPHWRLRVPRRLDSSFRCNEDIATVGNQNVRDFLLRGQEALSTAGAVVRPKTRQEAHPETTLQTFHGWRLAPTPRLQYPHDSQACCILVIFIFSNSPLPRNLWPVFP